MNPNMLNITNRNKLMVNYYNNLPVVIMNSTANILKYNNLTGYDLDVESKIREKKEYRW